LKLETGNWKLETKPQKIEQGKLIVEVERTERPVGCGSAVAPSTSLRAMGDKQPMLKSFAPISLCPHRSRSLCGQKLLNLAPTSRGFGALFWVAATGLDVRFCVWISLITQTHGDEAWRIKG
jgi:hypothetical protein